MAIGLVTFISMRVDGCVAPALGIVDAMTTPDWSSLRTLLRDEARRVLTRFFAEHDAKELTGVGFVFTLWNVTPQLDLCAHTSELAEDEEERFNSGDYDFPSGVTDERRELGPKVWEAIGDLHAQAGKEAAKGKAKSAVYRGLVELTSSVLLDLRDEKLIPDGVDFNVSEVGDDSELVAARHAMLSAWKVPDEGTTWKRVTSG